MPECELGSCGISCEFGCWCMEWLGSNCVCDCENVTAFKAPVDGVVDPAAQVRFTATDMPLLGLAAWFEFLFPDQILIPASRADTVVTTDGIVERLTLGELIIHLGLATASDHLQGRDFTAYQADT